VALRNLTASRPEATISYDVRRLENVVQAVSTGQADIGLVLNAERIETVNSDLLQRRNMVVLMPEDHPLAISEAVTPESLMPYPLIGIDVASQLGRLLKVGFDVSGVAYAPRIDVRYCQTAAALVASGMGVTVVDPYSAAPYLGRGLIIRPFMPVREVSAVMLTRKGVPHSAILSSFMEELRRAVETAPRGLAL
jgi:DNA-binding transcriptional LysR family regulator